jgi:hypothetical protein
MRNADTNFPNLAEELSERAMETEQLNHLRLIRTVGRDLKMELALESLAKIEHLIVAAFHDRHETRRIDARRFDFDRFIEVNLRERLAVGEEFLILER